jgi:hypothetical protein
VVVGLVDSPLPKAVMLLRLTMTPWVILGARIAKKLFHSINFWKIPAWKSLFNPSFGQGRGVFLLVEWGRFEVP